MTSLVASVVSSFAGSSAARRPIARLLGIAPAALLVSGLLAVWAGPLAVPVRATTPASSVVAWGDNTYGQTTIPAGLTGVTAISAGYGHVLALKSDGTVVSWGLNDYGQRAVPAGLSGVKAIAAGGDHSLALKADGTVVGWGNEDYGQTDVSSYSGVIAISAGASNSVLLLWDGTVFALGGYFGGKGRRSEYLAAHVRAISAGAEHFLYLKTSLSPTVEADGQNTRGQTTIPGGLDGTTISVAAGGYHSLALKSDGSVVAWGYNNSGQATVPTAAQSGVIAIAGGGQHSLALKSDGTVRAWGWNLSGQTNVPAGLSGVTAISAGFNFSLALVAPSAPGPLAWGSNSYGQTDVPTALLAGVKAVAGGWQHGLALRSNGTVAGWGNNTDGEATAPADLSGATAVAAGGCHSLALRSDGTLTAWGCDVDGQTTIPPGTSGVIAIAAGGGHTLALRLPGYVVAWGYNGDDETAVPTAAGKFVTAVAAGVYHSLALVAGGVVAWGDDSLGQSTVPVDAQSGVIAIAAGEHHSLALKSDGTVIAWGDNSYGQTNVPEGLSGIVAIAAGRNHSLALKVDGTIVSWGDNGSGQISIPSGLSGVTAIAAGGYFTLALESTGATHFTVTTANPWVAGGAHTVTITAKDAYGNTVTGYLGTIHVTSSDPAAVLPADSAFTVADAGVHKVIVTLRTAGSRSVTATDTVTAPITGSQTVTVNPGAAKTLTVVTANPWVAGASHTVTITAKDAFGNTATGYLGSIRLTSTDAQAVLPGDYTFLASDHGVHGLIINLKTAGSRSVTATDTVTASITGSQTITVNPGAAKSFTVVSVTPWVAGAAHTVTITAKDAYGNTATGYLGTIHLTSTDTAAVLPANYTFLASDHGVHRLVVTLKTAGSRTVTATDTVTATIKGTSTAITVTPAAAKTFTLVGAVPWLAGASHSVTVTARDAYGNVATAYGGTVHLTSSDVAAVLPADYTFVVGDAGVHKLTVKLKTVGSQWVRATDTHTATITGSVTITVS